MTQLLILPILIPLGTAIMLLLFRQFPQVRRALTFASGAAIFTVSIFLFSYTWNNGIHYYKLGGWPPPFGIIVVGDLLSSLMVLLASLISNVAMLYSFGYLENDEKRMLFHPLFYFLWTGVNGAFLTGDIFNLFVFFEVMLMSVYCLLSMFGEKKQLEAGIKFISMGLISSTFFLTAVAGIYALTGSLNMADIAVKIKPYINNPLTIVVCMLFVSVFSLKSALIPLHFWLPDVHSSAPTPISAMLSGILVKVGAYCIIRLFCLIFTGLMPTFQTLILTMACVSMVIGVMGAVAQTDLKRLLAFHSVSQMGYVTLGIGFFTVAGISSALFYIISHAIIKSSLFLTSGIMKKMNGSTDLGDHGEIITISPFLALFFLIGVTSLAGIPPSVGFFMKFQVIKAGIDSGKYIHVIIALLVSLFTLFSVLRAWQKACWYTRKKEFKKKPGFALLAPLGILAVLCIVFGFASNSIINVTNAAAKQLFSPETYISAVMRK